nr:HEAT repeat domain-containing protein [Planctomycetota bacterium]
QPSPHPMATPHIILCGFGVTDSLQLTVETQRALARYGAAYTLGRLGIMGAFPQIAALLRGDPDPDVRAAAAFALGDLGVSGDRRVVPELINAWYTVGAEDELAVLVVRAKGRGVVVPQEIDATINIRGVQDLLDVAFDLRDLMDNAKRDAVDRAAIGPDRGKKAPK